MPDSNPNESFREALRLFQEWLNAKPASSLQEFLAVNDFSEQVESLLREQVEGSVSNVVSGKSNDVFPETATVEPVKPAKARKKIGPYKLLQKIGEGGMGTVWMAEQVEPIRRRVALKIISQGMDSEQVVARFEAERQALAMMDHQHIAKVLDAGKTESGSPYFVMELVQGIPVNQYCDRNKLPLADRLRLFTQICHAVQHAHQKGIIHRDLKPSNVLVQICDGQPVAKVIDFGVAKALQHQARLTDKTLFTEFGQIVGTVQYMSPEQAMLDALNVDTRSDIYSLGVMLYELLAGSTPIEQETIKRNALLQVLELIREKDPQPPSDRLSSSGEQIANISELRQIQPMKLQQILRGELDWVVMKALDKDRTRRYETAASFAEDIERFLNGDAVIARPPSRSYLFRKFVARNRRLVTGAAAIGLILIIALGLVSWFALKSDSALKDKSLALEQARSRFDLAVEAVNRYHDGITNEVLFSNPEFVELRNGLLDSARVFYERLTDDLAESKDPYERKTLGESLLKLAEINSKIGSVDQSISLASRAKDIFVKLNHIDGDNGVVELLGDSYFQLAKLNQKQVNSDQSLQYAQLASEQFRILHDREPNNSKISIKLARSILAEAALGGTDSTETIEDFVSFTDSGLSTEEVELFARFRLVSANSTLAEGDRERAKKLLLEGKRKLLEILRPKPDQRQLSLLLVTLNARLRNVTQSTSELEALFTESREVLERLLDQHPNDHIIRSSLASLLRIRAERVFKNGFPSEAVELMKTAVAHFELIMEEKQFVLYGPLRTI